MRVRGAAPLVPPAAATCCGGMTGPVRPPGALRNDVLQRWHGPEPELQTQATALRDPFFSAAALGDCDPAMVRAGEAFDLIHDIPTAALLRAGIVAQAESQIRHAAAGLALSWSWVDQRAEAVWALTRGAG